jgi:uracil-DNA glycosylase
MAELLISDPEADLSALLADIRACRECVARPRGAPLSQEPRPVLRVSTAARLLIASQAPGIRVHKSGMPFTDASGDRLRQWMGIDKEAFYDESRVAIVPMGFCFPGWDAKKSDLPPRPECRALWHDRLFGMLPAVETILVVGGYARAYHLARLGHASSPRETLTKVVSRWRDFSEGKPKVIVLPHPSWRNNGWLRANAWFEAELLPVLRDAVRAATVCPDLSGE